MVKLEEEPSSSSQDSVTAADYISSQLTLEREAKELMPYDPNTCTFSLGSLRQQVYACLTCFDQTKQLAGVCYSCSIQCHSDHNIVELFTKRQFTCDCGTTRIHQACNLRSKAENDIPSSSNVYNHNYKGTFCHCDQDYNPVEETGNMLQCILGDVCQEDWYHEYCIMGLPKLKPEVHVENEKGVNILDSLDEPKLGEGSNESYLGKEDEFEDKKMEGNNNVDQKINNHNEEDDNDNDAEDEEEEAAIDGFPRLDSFGCFICWKCVSKHQDFFDLIRSNGSVVTDILQRIESESIEDRNDKLIESTDFNGSFKKRKITYEYSVFLKDNHEENFTNFYKDNSKDETVAKFFKSFPFLLKDDPVYEPPPEEEDDDNSSILDLGAKAINSLPRVQAIQGVKAYEDIKDKLKSFLAPFAQDGKIVNKEDIESFFSALKK